jgi:hypothetical protein
MLIRRTLHKFGLSLWMSPSHRGCDQCRPRSLALLLARVICCPRAFGARCRARGGVRYEPCSQLRKRRGSASGGHRRKGVNSIGPNAAVIPTPFGVERSARAQGATRSGSDAAGDRLGASAQQPHGPLCVGGLAPTGSALGRSAIVGDQSALGLQTTIENRHSVHFGEGETGLIFLGFRSVIGPSDEILDSSSFIRWPPRSARRCFVLRCWEDPSHPAHYPQAIVAGIGDNLQPALAVRRQSPLTVRSRGSGRSSVSSAGGRASARKSGC